MKVDHAKVADWMRENWKDESTCPVCGTNDWRIGDDVIEMGPVQSFRTTGMVYPLIALFCARCGYTILFNAIIGGVVDSVKATGIDPNPVAEKKEG